MQQARWQWAGAYPLGRQTSVAAATQSGCQITIMVFIHKFISLFKHASEFSPDTINKPTGCEMPSAAAPQTFRSVFFIPFALDPLGHRLLGPMDGWVAMGWDGFGWHRMGWGRLDHSKPNAVATHEYRHRSALRCYFNDYADEQRWPAMATRAMIHQSSGHGNAICVIYADAQRTQPDTQILSECVCVFVCLRLARRSGRYKMFGYRRCRAQTTCLPLSGST